MSAFDYFKTVVFEKYALFEGRSRRSEFWYFILFNTILGYSLVGLSYFSSIFLYANWAYSLVLFIPNVAVNIRRLHDIGKSGWWILSSLTIIMIPVLIYWYCMDSEPGSNEYGSNPKTGGDDGILDQLV